MSASIDSSYRLLFSQPTMVEDLLKGYVHQAWVQELDFSTLEPVKTDHLSDRLDERRNDCIWRVRWQGQKRWLYVYLLLEFQSRPDHSMAVRLMTYLGLLYQHLYRSKQVSPREVLPPVLPVVLYNGERNWQAPTRIQALIADPPRGLEAYLPQFEYLLIDEKDYAEAPFPEARNLVSALFALENTRRPEDIKRILPLLIDWLHHPEQQSLKRAFAVWMRRAFLPGRVKGVELDESEGLEEINIMLAERVKSWTKDWEQQGIQKGIEKGIEQGEAALLRRLLVKRFGSLPDSYEKRFEDATRADIERWGDALLEAADLEDVFKE